MDDISRYTMLTLGALVLMGGIMGFVKGKSKASLLSGLICAALYVVAYLLSMPHFRSSLALGDLVSIALIAIGIMRLRKTKKFMPAGLMLIFGGLGAIMFSLALLQYMRGS